MGGAIGVDSQEGQGSTFWFTAVFGVASPVPQQPAGERKAPPCEESPRAGGGAPIRVVDNAARILVAEDNAVNREVALAQLGKLGYRATAVANGAEAVEAVEQGGYDLLLMDCEMPVMDGFEATRRIRASAHPDIPIIAITADAMPADRDRCLREGMNDYLAKPVELGALADALARCLPVAGDGVFNAETLLRRLMGDRQLAGVVLNAFLDDFPSQLIKLRARLDRSDAPGVRSQVHAIKGAVATVSADSLHAIALAMELPGTDTPLDRCGALLPRAAEEFDRFRDTLERNGWVKKK